MVTVRLRYAFACLIAHFVNPSRESEMVIDLLFLLYAFAS
jgi:hypothetical protein